MGVAVLSAGRRDVLDSRRARTATLTVTLGGVAALAAVTSTAAPTGLRVLDELYVAGFTAVVAYYAGWGRRWTWFLPAGVGAACAADGLSLALAAASIVLGSYSVLTDSRTRARGALVVGLGMAALLRTDPVGFHGLTALLAAAAVLPIIRSGYRLAARRVKRQSRKVFWLACAPVALMGIGLAVGLYTVYEDLFRGMDLVDEGVVAARDADDDEAALRLSEASRHLSTAAETLDSWFVRPARALPLVGQNLRAVERLSDETSEVARLSALAATAADVDALQFRDGRIDPTVLQSMVEPMNDVSTALEQAQGAVDDVRSPWLAGVLASYMDELDDQLDENLPDVQTALKAVEMTNSLLGGEGHPRRYLVLFTTPDEARGRSGFAGNFAELVADNGQVDMVRFGRISELDNEGVLPRENRVISNPALADYLQRYERFDPASSWRNLNMSPDLPTIALAASELYPQSGGSFIDGVLTVDPAGLAALMHFIRPIDPEDLEGAEGMEERLTHENVEDFLLYDQYVNFADRAERIDFLDDVAELTFERLTTEAEVPSPREAIDILDPVVEGGHIQFTTLDPDEAAYFDEIGLSGRFGGAGNDFVSVVTSNAGGNKIDYFLQRNLRYDVIWDPATTTATGRITATLTNTCCPADVDLPNYFDGNSWDLPEGTNRSYVSIYSAYDLDQARIDGQPAALESAREVNRNVYSTFVNIPPGASVTIELDVSGAWAPGPFGYGVSFQPQPLHLPETLELSLTVAGETELGDLIGEGARLEDRTVRWSGELLKQGYAGIAVEIPDTG